ncbi:NADH dehydrogenase, putative [Perkinsus marinus ATCC 50983]|uniref:NADH:ubiquinone reductase (non-electrogenic) n=1 Tax=Perkinsus marinus (strain ATCC 50983 / TXsc) TaxID=423536 RepID=C5KI44_PERM5|nr:NADH dehydrogenase, putative [Perkinsus marinus ATCC 50983]EER16256.1 NADH dehydrogenase, putative [Perkinsus marinus ATCC 50983]|eukprot:XP_002784460.1 NADH dehydrogenase, putative [Perkinsus marinus ATCC 50983]
MSSTPLKPGGNLVILGSGWGGYSLLKKLDTSKWDSVTLVSPRNYFLFTPLLPSVTVGTNEPRSIIEPVRKTIMKKNKKTGLANTRYLEVVANHLDLDQKVSSRHPSPPLAKQCVPYDKLVVAVGAQPNTMGVPGVLEYTHFLKEMDHARLIRKNVLDSFETACTAQSDERKRELLHFVVVGGGPTGVEFAAELSDFIREEISHAYWEVAHLAKVSVIQSAENILNTFDAAISRYATDHFKRIDIDVVKNSRVKAVEATAVVVQDMATKEERRIPFGVCVWAAGIAPRPFTKDLISQLKGYQPENGRLLKTTPYLEVLGSKGDLFAIGDCAGVAEPELLPLAESLFDEADINKDGEISFQEYEVIYRKIRERFPLLQGVGAKQRWKDHADKYNGGKPLEFLTRDLWEKVLANMQSSYKAMPATAQVASQQGNITGVSTFALWRGVYASKMVSWRCRHLVIWDWIKAYLYGRDLSKM